MFRRLTLFLAVAAVCFGAYPRPLADIPIPMPDGKKIVLKKYRGKVVALAMILTTCSDCSKTVSILDKMQTDFGSRGFQAIAVALDDEAASTKMALFAQRYRPTFPVGWLDAETARKLGDMPASMHPMVPVILFIDGAGTVRLQYYGNDPVFKEQEKAFRAIVDSLLKKNAADQAAKPKQAAAAAPKQ
jgi:peroxiredoxin